MRAVIQPRVAIRNRE